MTFGVRRFIALKKIAGDTGYVQSLLLSTHQFHRPPVTPVRWRSVANGEESAPDVNLKQRAEKL